jgi:sugar phosphate isomerase/epimerase
MWSGLFFDHTPEAAVTQLTKADYRFMELSTEHSDILLQRSGTPEAIGSAFGAFAREQGISVEQGHLYIKADLCSPESVPLLKKWLDMYQAIGIRSAVLHAAAPTDTPEEQQHELRIAHLNQLTQHVKGGDITICLENLGSYPPCHTARKLLKLIDDVDDSSRLGICLDTGHLHRVNFQALDNQSFEDFILSAGSRLKALHINGNNGLLDDHLMPFTGSKNLDWKPVMRSLAAVGYDRLFNMELPGEKKAPLQVRMLKLEYLKK